MCGIAGFQGRFEASLLENMNDMIIHRGPDDQGLWTHPKTGTGFAHRRLSIIDLSANGHQPMTDLGGRAVIVFNGEIYNYRELKEDLVARGYEFRGNSDTEVLLNAYLAYGEEMLKKLNGIFAFAIFDHRDGSILLARDGFGVKPFYYAETDQGLLFGSEMKSLLKAPGINWDVDNHALQTYLTFLWSPSPNCLIKGIKKLPPGHAITVSQGKVQKIWQYYEMPFDAPILDLSERELIDLFDKTMEQAVVRQMVSDVGVGAFLSGGLDSSAIVAYARQHYDRSKFQCFTIGFKDDDFKNDGAATDLPYAIQAAKHLDVDLHIVEVDRSMVKYLESMIYHLDEPQPDLASMNTHMICTLARDHGLKVLLSGAGGDDILAGYSRHRALMLERVWSWLPKPMRQILRTSTNLLPKGNPKLRRLSKAFAHAQEDQVHRLISYFFWISEQQSRNLLQADRRANLPFVGQTFLDRLGGIPQDTDALNKMLFCDTKFFLTDHNLNYTDKLSMAAGIETRVPFLDNDLVKLSCQLPLNTKLRGTTGKWILRKAMEPHLPQNILYRPKSGFGVPLRSWLRGDLKPYVDDILSEGSVKNRGLFDPKAVTKLVNDDKAGKVDAAYSIFGMMCTELWFRIFLDKGGDQGYSLGKNGSDQHRAQTSTEAHKPGAAVNI